MRRLVDVITVDPKKKLLEDAELEPERKMARKTQNQYQVFQAQRHQTKKYFCEIKKQHIYNWISDFLYGFFSTLEPVIAH